MIFKSIDCVTPHATPFHDRAHLFVFTENEAVIKMIVRGKTHTCVMLPAERVDLDRLFERMNLDSCKSIRYPSTDQHIADMMTKGFFTRGTRDHLLSFLEVLSRDSSYRSRLKTTGIPNPPHEPTAMPRKSSEFWSSSLTQEDDAKRGSRLHRRFSSGWEETLSIRHDKVNTITTVRWNDPWMVATGDPEQRSESRSH